MTNQVIDHSKQHTLKMRIRERALGQKAALILSTASLHAVTLVANQWINSKSSNLNQNEHCIASPKASDLRRNIQWGHELARQFSLEKGLSHAALTEPFSDACPSDLQSGLETYQLLDGK